MTVRAAISDPLPLLRSGIAAALQQDGYSVDEPAGLLARCANGRTRADRDRPDNLRPVGTLSDLFRERPAVRTVALLPEMAAAGRAVRAGAAAVLPRDADADHLREACRAVRRDECAPPVATVPDLLHRTAHWEDEIRLEDQELSWLRLLAGGRTVAKVAATCGYSERMMFRLLRDLYTRLGVGSRTEAMLLAREHGRCSARGSEDLFRVVPVHASQRTTRLSVEAI